MKEKKGKRHREDITHGLDYVVKCIKPDIHIRDHYYKLFPFAFGELLLTLKKNTEEKPRDIIKKYLDKYRRGHRKFHAFLTDFSREYDIDFRSEGMKKIAETYKQSLENIMKFYLDYKTPKEPQKNEESVLSSVKEKSKISNENVISPIDTTPEISNENIISSIDETPEISNENTISLGFKTDTFNQKFLDAFYVFFHCVNRIDISIEECFKNTSYLTEEEKINNAILWAYNMNIKSVNSLEIKEENRFDI